MSHRNLLKKFVENVGRTLRNQGAFKQSPLQGLAFTRGEVMHLSALVGQLVRLGIQIYTQTVPLILSRVR